MNSWRHFELLLPVRRNDGEKIPPELFTETFLQLETRFGGVSWDTQTVRGRWRSEGQTHEDGSVRVSVDVPDTEENRLFFANLKGELKVRFQQLRHLDDIAPDRYRLIPSPESARNNLGWALARKGVIPQPWAELWPKKL